MIKNGYNDTQESKDTILEVVLDDGDEIIDCIERSFKQNDIKKASLLSAVGTLRELKIATTKIGSIRQKTYDQPCLITNVSGDFTKTKSGEYMGDVHISFARDAIHKESGVLLRGISHGEVKLKFKVITDLSIGVIKTPEGRRNITLVKQKILEETTSKPKKPFIVS